jgi:hypothetical protein
MRRLGPTRSHSAHALTEWRALLLRRRSLLVSATRHSGLAAGARPSNRWPGDGGAAPSRSSDSAASCYSTLVRYSSVRVRMRAARSFGSSTTSVSSGSTLNSGWPLRTTTPASCISTSVTVPAKGA